MSKRRRLAVRVAAVVAVLGGIAVGAFLSGVLPPEGDGIGKTVRVTLVYKDFPPCYNPAYPRVFGVLWRPSEGNLSRREAHPKELPGRFTRHDVETATFVAIDGRTATFVNNHGNLTALECSVG